MRRTFGISFVCLLGAMACGESDDPPAEDTGETDGVFRFDDLDDAEKSAYMVSDVLPRMQEVFQAYDPDAYASFSCTTCHVEGSADGSYAMPDPGLPPLQEDAFPYTSEVGRFMGQEVLPEMNDLLGPTEGGRPCITCHTLEE